MNTLLINISGFDIHLAEAIENAAKMLVASAQPVPTSQEILSAQVNDDCGDDL